MSYKRNKQSFATQQESKDRKPIKPNSSNSKLRESIVKKLHNTFQDNFDLSLIATVAQTCEWDSK